MGRFVDDVEHNADDTVASEEEYREKREGFLRVAEDFLRRIQESEHAERSAMAYQYLSSVISAWSEYAEYCYGTDDEKQLAALYFAEGAGRVRMADKLQHIYNNFSGDDDAVDAEAGDVVDL